MLIRSEARKETARTHQSICPICEKDFMERFGKDNFVYVYNGKLICYDCGREIEKIEKNV